MEVDGGEILCRYSQGWGGPILHPQNRDREAAAAGYVWTVCVPVVLAVMPRVRIAELWAKGLSG